MTKLFNTYSIGNLTLQNRVVMAPLTRSRAINNIPNDIMTSYYSQRAGAGLIITEGTAPSANGLGYARIPGMYSKEQIEGWKKVTDAVHEKGAKIFVQLMHTGRASHPYNMEAGTKILAPSAIGLSGELHTDAEGMQAYPTPKAMSEKELLEAQEEFVQASVNAILAGFDGVEIHGANGYLIDQFLNPASNQREDKYGQDRRLFLLETAEKVSAAIGANRVGVRVSPYGIFNDMKPFDGLEDFYESLAKDLGAMQLAYIHIADMSSMGGDFTVTATVKEKIKNAFGGAIILSGGYDAEKAEKDLQADKGALVAFGRPFISNPDLVYRMKNKQKLNEVDFNTLYTPGEEGYTDYPALETQAVS